MSLTLNLKKKKDTNELISKTELIYKTEIHQQKWKSMFIKGGKGEE